MSTPNPKTVWSRIYDDVKIQIPGVTDAVFKQMLLQVWGDFTDRTNIWIEQIPFDVDPNTLQYPITPVKFGQIHRLLLVYDQAAASPSYNWVQSGIEMYVPGIITLRWQPNAGTWVAVVAKNYDDPDANGYPEIDPSDEWIVHKYGDGLHYGVLGRLQAMPAKPYSNPKLGAQNWQVYVSERSKARVDALHSNVLGAQRWAFPQSFAVYHKKGWT
jgi:hypothetical protein